MSESGVDTEANKVNPPNPERQQEVENSVKYGISNRTFETSIREFGLTSEKLKGKKILDVGGGFGQFAEEVTKLGANIVRVDPLYDPEYRGTAPQGIIPESLKNKHNAIAGMAQELPFQANSFDFTLANHSIFWTDEYEHSILEMFRVTRQGGSIRIFPGVHKDGDLEKSYLPLGARVIPVGGGESMLEITKTNIPPDQAAAGIKRLLQEVKVSRKEIVKVLFPKK
jgi:ubiquinone/menaquinone biosynthesis C-methylase UbiE